MSIEFLQTDRGYKLAYRYLPAAQDKSGLPVVVFIHGFKSDMDGTKSMFLEDLCRTKGQGFLRFDCYGHGKSEGDFEKGTIGQWKQDVLDMLDNIAQGDVILVGSSMGGWLALLALLERPERVQRLIGIAAAPDFTKEIEGKFTPQQQQEMLEHGLVRVPNEYSSDPYVFTKALIEDGLDHCLLDDTYNISASIRLLQGKQDDAVPWEKALRIEKCFKGPDTQVTLIDDGDHSLSRECDLQLLEKAIAV